MNMGIIAGSRLKEVLNLFGDLGNATNKWTGGVLAPNGKIYGIPTSSNKILEIDPSNNTTSLFGDLSVIGSGLKWRGGVLAPNGKIYGIPANTTKILEIDPVNQTTSLFGNVGNSDSDWYGGVLAPNGKIYCIPLNATQILVIDNLDTPNIIGSDANIPASLANLATSNYNEYYNKL